MPILTSEASWMDGKTLTYFAALAGRKAASYRRMSGDLNLDTCRLFPAIFATLRIENEQYRPNGARPPRETRCSADFAY